MASFADHLAEEGLLPSTREKYVEIIDAVGGKDLLGSLRKKVKEGSPLGTVLPLRAAITHYLRMLGYDMEEVRKVLPKAEGKPADIRTPLDAEQLATFHYGLEALPEPVRTLLGLLPLTGMSISEACNLQVADVTKTRRGFDLRVTSRGRVRIVPLSGPAITLLSAYLEEEQPKGWLFAIKGRPVQAPTVRKYTRALAKEYESLVDLCPQQLRVTYAVMELKRGRPLDELRVLLGHKSLQTTQRYLGLAVFDG